MTKEDLIEECDGVIGAAWMMEQAEEAAVVLTY